jgi:hypothetical protein
MATTDGVITLLPPPEGYVVNFDNPTRQGEHEAYYIAGFGLAISFLFFMQRMYVKIFLAGGLQIDDSKFTTCHFFTSLHFFLLGVGSWPLVNPIDLHGCGTSCRYRSTL